MERVWRTQHSSFRCSQFSNWHNTWNAAFSFLVNWLLTMLHSVTASQYSQWRTVVFPRCHQSTEPWHRKSRCTSNREFWVTPLIYIHTTHPVIHSATHTHIELFTWRATHPGVLYRHHIFSARAVAHLKIDEDSLHVLRTQDLLQRDHVILKGNKGTNRWKCVLQE